MDPSLGFPCPSCGLLLGGGPTSPAGCPRCRIPLRGPLAGALDAVDRELAQLVSRTNDLLGRRTDLLLRLRAMVPPLPLSPPPARTTPFVRTAPPVQTTLLALGALLLSVAGTIFTVLAWGRLGIAGRAAVLLAGTCLAAGATTVLRRRRLHSTSDAVAVLTLVLSALDLHALRLLIAPQTSPAAWWAGAAAVLTIVGAAAAARLRLPALLTTAATVGQAVLPLALLAALAERPSSLDLREALVLVALTLTAAGSLDLCGRPLLGGSPWARPASRVVTWFGHGQLASAGAVAVGTTLASSSVGDAAGGAAVLLLLAGVCGLAAWFGTDDGAAWWAGASALALVLTVAGLCSPVLRDSDALGRVTVLVPPVLMGLVLVAAARRLPDRLVLGPLVVGLATAGTCALPTLGRAVITLVAPLRLLGQPWSPDAPARVAELVPAGGVVDVGDCLLLALLATAFLLTPVRKIGRPAARSIGRPAAGLMGRPAARSIGRPAAATSSTAALLLLAPALDLPLPLAVTAGLSVLPLAAAHLLLASRPHVGALLATAAVAGTALCWSAASPVLTLTAVAVLALTAAVPAATASVATALRSAATATAAGAALGLAPLTVLALDAGPVKAGAVLAALAAGTLLATDRPHPDKPRMAMLGTAAGMAALGTLLAADDPDLLSLVLAGLGLAALAAAARPHRQPSAVLGGLLLLAAGEIRLVEAAVRLPEAYTLPAALLALLVGEVVRRRRSELDPTLLLSPGLLLALLPSLLLCLSGNEPLRPLLLTAGAFAVVVAGSLLRLRAPLAIGALTLAAIAVRQLAPLAFATPRWIVLGVVGLMLLTLGARYERTRDEMGRLRRSLTRLS